MLEYSIVKKAQFTIVGIRRRFNSDTSYQEIPKFWDELLAQGEDRPIKGTFGVCLDMEGKEFNYLIADLYFPWDEIPEGCETRVIPESIWAQFPCTIDTLQDTNTKIWSEWLPALKGYSLAGEYDVEVYLPPKEGSDDMTIYIWVPLKKTADGDNNSIRIRFNRRALCAGDDVNNGIYDIQMPEYAMLSDLIEVLLHGGNGCDWPIPWDHDGWLIYSNIGNIAHVSGDLKRVEYCGVQGSAELSGLGIEWVFGEYEGADPEETTFTCRCMFGE